MTDWPGKAFWDGLADPIIEEMSLPDEIVCLQCGEQIDSKAPVCPECSGDPTAPLPLDFTDFTDDDWERL